MSYELSIIIPFLNEQEGIPDLLKSLNEYFHKFNRLSSEVIFVDDGSTDQSVKLLYEGEHKSYKARIVKLSKNFGSLNALYAGISYSRAPLIAFMYSDLQDPLYLIEMMYSKSIEGYDIVWAERKTVEVKGIRLFSKLYAALMRRYAVEKFPENGYDVVMFNKKVKEIILRNIENNSSIFLQIISLGFKQTSIFYDKQARKSGKSKWTLKKKIKLVIDSFIAFSYMPIRFVTICGIIMFLLGVIYATFLFIYKLSGAEIAYGWSGLIIMLAIGLGVTNISLGIIAEYLWRTLDATRKRPVFIVDEILDVD